MRRAFSASHLRSQRRRSSQVRCSVSAVGLGHWKLCTSVVDAADPGLECTPASLTAYFRVFPFPSSGIDRVPA